MKKTIATILLGAIFAIVPVSVSAQTVDQSALDELKAQLIALLMEQVAALQIQLAALQADQDDLRASVESDEEGEFGAVEEVVVEAPAQPTVDLVYEQGEEDPDGGYWGTVTVSGDFDYARMFIWAEGAATPGNDGAFTSEKSFDVGPKYPGTYTWEVTAYLGGKQAENGWSGGEKVVETGSFVIE